MTNATHGLVLAGITAGYDGTTVLRDVSLRVPPSSVVALLGPNGAGKTTTLRVAAGLINPTAGTVSLGAADLRREGPHERALSGLCMIPEGRGIFRTLTVAENLRLLTLPRGKAKRSTDEVLEIFPALRGRMKQTAGTMSGGQQQMLSLARAYLSSPSVILLDEVSMGLSPIVVEQIYVALRDLVATGVSLLLVEQYVSRALELADHVVLMNKGSVSFSGAADQVDEDTLARSYLGDGTAEAVPA